MMSVEHTRGKHPGIASLMLSKPFLNNLPFNLIILSISQEGFVELCSSVACAKKPPIFFLMFGHTEQELFLEVMFKNNIGIIENTIS